MSKQTVTIAKGDGIGPEIMDAVLKVFEAAAVPLNYEFIEVGEQLYQKGITSGIADSAWGILKKNKVLLKAPITTPQGKGCKSLNVTLRKTLSLFANVRPCISYAPHIATKHPNMDLVIVRENEEDLYAGIEHRLTEDVYQCLKLITHQGCERIIRYAFEFARDQGRKRVTAFVKDNIMKFTDGIFHDLFNAVAKEYPEIEHDHYIVDIGTARLADTPEIFDVIVTLNLYGDIISDVAAQIAGSVGLAGSSNIGDDFAMFEAIHGSAPDIAGQNIANPSGLLQAGIMMLCHLNLNDYAEKIQNAWRCVIEEGCHTADIFCKNSKEKCSTKAFTKKLIAKLGKTPKQFEPAHYVHEAPRVKEVKALKRTPVKMELRGVDVFINEQTSNSCTLGERLEKANQGGLKLQMISARGLSVWPICRIDGLEGAFWRCRFLSKEEIPYTQTLELLKALYGDNIQILKTENLSYYDGLEGFSKAQGQ